MFNASKRTDMMEKKETKRRMKRSDYTRFLD